jgi:processive 1,2-diacylglycerol beta-glucosyltransferase
MYTPANVANSVMAIKLKKYFDREFYPDVIVCTHVFSAQVVNVMKARGLLNVPVIGIVTDYTIHPFWQDVSHIDYFVTASELLSLQAVKKGIRKEQLLPFGIPINRKFSRRVEKAEARRQLGIDEDKQTVLLMSGSMGYGNISHVLSKIDEIDADFQILAVCGNNRHAKRKIGGMKTQKKVYCYGFANNVDLMMDASDCIVTKPGGLTISEALAKHLPIIMVNPIPGQEERNVEFMLNNGLAINVTNTFPIDEAIYQLFLYPEKLNNMIKNIQLVGKPNATSDLCDFIMNLNENK